MKKFINKKLQFKGKRHSTRNNFIANTTTATMNILKHTKKTFNNKSNYLDETFNPNIKKYTSELFKNTSKKVFSLDSEEGRRYKYMAIEGYHEVRRLKQQFLNYKKKIGPNQQNVGEDFFKYLMERKYQFSLDKQRANGRYPRYNNTNGYRKSYQQYQNYQNGSRQKSFKRVVAKPYWKFVSSKSKIRQNKFQYGFQNKPQGYFRNQFLSKSSSQLPYQFRNRAVLQSSGRSQPYFRIRNRYSFNKRRRWQSSSFRRNIDFRGGRRLPKGSRFKTWRTCKKPFWKRKNFQFIKLYNLIFLNFFKAYTRRRLKIRKMRRKKVTGFTRRGKKRKKRFFGKRFWYEYFRRNKTKFWFRNKIALRFAWMARYSCWSHHKAANFVWRVRRRTPALLRFWLRHEFTLDRYILWWQIAPKLTGNRVEFSRWLIQGGYVYVNFIPELNPRYRIKLGDCIFVLKQIRGSISQGYITSKLMNPFKSKFRRGYRLRCITRFQPRYLYKERFKNFLKRYKMLRHLSHWNKAYFLYYQYFVERSYKYRIFVNLHAMNWLTLIFSTIGKMHYPMTYYFINSFVNRRYG